MAALESSIRAEVTSGVAGQVWIETLIGLGVEMCIRDSEDIVPNEFPSTDWPVLGWGRHRGYHGRGPIHGLGPFQAIATRDRGHDVYYLTVCCPGFAFADPPGCLLYTSRCV